MVLGYHAVNSYRMVSNCFTAGNMVNLCQQIIVATNISENNLYTTIIYVHKLDRHILCTNIYIDIHIKLYTTKKCF